MAKHLRRLGLFVFFAFTFFMSGINVNAKEVTITPTMSQDEINDSISSLDVVTVTAGDYATIASDGRNYHKYIVADGTEITVNLSGNYERLQLITKNNGTIHIVVNGNTTLNGEASSVYNPSAALGIQSGTMDITTNGSILTITDYNNGIRLGNNIAGTSSASANLTLKANANVVITNSSNLVGVTKETAYYDCYNDFGDPGVAYGWGDAGNFVQEGNRGSAIYTRGAGATHTITLNNGSKLDVSGNDGSGIYVGYDSKNNRVNNVYINTTNATLTSNNNGYIGLFEDGKNTANYYLTAVNSTLSFSNNASNGMTGHSYSTIDLTNSTMNVDNNGAMGINNGYIILNSSKLTGNNNGSHGITNISLDATDSTVEASNNAYIGVNITKYNANKASTDIINSTITANNNGGAGVRFYIDNGVTNVTDSHITTNENGYGKGSYGWEGHEGLSDYWGGTLVKGNIYVKNSIMMSDGVNGYALYNNSTGKATFYVLENSVVVGNGDESKDIFDDYNSGKGNSGSTVVEGGSLQVDNDNVSASDSLNDKYHNEQNPTMPSGQGSKDEVQYAGPVNSDNTALTQFVLHQNINKEVGGAGSHTFTYYDPNTGTRHDYTFRYNELGEDLDPNASGNAYIWAPVSILRYDATEGFISSLGTAGLVKFGYGYTDLMTGLYTRYTSDVTIFGNSMNLAEKVLALASREGYVFLGWYIADDQELAAKYASEGNFEELYKLLNTKFDGSTKLEINGKPVSELTVYAKWAIPDDEPGTGATFGPSEELEITPPSTGVIASKNIYTELLIIISVLGTASLFTVSRNKD